MSYFRVLPNILSIVRGASAFLFLNEKTSVRLAAICIALVTDYLDGFLARRYKLVTRVGTVLDPIMDKFFVLFAAAVFLIEGRLNIWCLLALISRDLFLCLFALYLKIRGSWSNYRFRAIWWGKVTTVGQLLLLLGLTLNLTPPPLLFAGFLFLGLLSFIELYSGLTKIDHDK
ncbi:MAG: CDP-alcohol phosphatidyltransferase family protein [Parachlamydiales bacterium]|nr:CDP-alcohol phosphatidyltransferase family protein [Parachlamydiales bacterium]